MRLRFLIATLMAALVTAAVGQVPSASAYSVADLMAWSAFFYRVNWYESIANHDAAQGLNDSLPRSVIQREIALTSAEIASVKAVAADWKSKWDPIMSTTRSMMTSGATAKTSPALMAVRNQRDAMVASHIDLLATALGPSRFAVLSHHVHLHLAGATGITVPWKTAH